MRNDLRPSGFTLVELLVSLAIGGLVVLAVQASLAGTLRVARGEERGGVATSLRAEAVRTHLREWIEGAATASAGWNVRLSGRDGVRAGLPADTLELVTLDRGILIDGAAESPVRLRISLARGGGVRVAYGEPEATGFTDSLRVLRDVHGIDVRYYAPLRGGDGWRDGWTDGDEVPRAVEVRLYPAPGRELPRELQVPLLVPLSQR